MGIFSNLFDFGDSKKANIKDEINIMEAINAHIRWKVRLEKYVNGTSEETLDPKVICLDDQCVLGKWIHGPAIKHFHDDEGFKSLRDEHARFHVIASHVVESVQANDMDKAAALIKGEYMNASRKVVHSLTELNKQLIN